MVNDLGDEYIEENSEKDTNDGNNCPIIAENITTIGEKKIVPHGKFNFHMYIPH